MNSMRTPHWRELPLRVIKVALVASAVTLFGQQQETPPPNPLGQPLLDAAGHLRDDAFIRIPLRPEDRKYADLDGTRMKEVLLEVDAISLADRDAGTIFWGRNVGTAGHVATEDWVEGYFRRHGLEDVHRQSFHLRPQCSRPSANPCRGRSRFEPRVTGFAGFCRASSRLWPRLFGGQP